MLGLADFLYPQPCAGCGRLARGGLCQQCLAGIPRLGPATCRTCGMVTRNSSISCRECSGRRFEFDRAVQITEFDGAVRAAIHRFKYASEKSLGVMLGKLLAEGLPVAAQALTWPPAAPDRMVARGFDHARFLAESLGTITDLPVVGLLSRTRRTAAQMTLAQEERRTNLRGAFCSKTTLIPSVVVIDDVFTTGATADEAARALKAAGVGSVTSLSIARSLPKGMAGRGMNQGTDI